MYIIRVLIYIHLKFRMCSDQIWIFLNLSMIINVILSNIIYDRNRLCRRQYSTDFSLYRLLIHYIILIRNILLSSRLVVGYRLRGPRRVSRRLQYIRGYPSLLRSSFDGSNKPPEIRTALIGNVSHPATAARVTCVNFAMT